MRKLKSLITLVTLLYGIHGQALEYTPMSITEDRGFFSLGLAIGVAKSGLQNTNGNYSGYQTNVLGADLEFKIFGNGAGQVGIFGSFLYGEGKNNTNQNDKFKNQETSIGLKVGLSSNFYISAAVCNNRLSLSSSSTTTSLALTHTATKVALGFETPISEEFFFGLEANYRMGAVKKADNPELTNNTSYEGASLLIKLIWSPPAVTNNYNMKKSFR